VKASLLSGIVDTQYLTKCWSFANPVTYT